MDNTPSGHYALDKMTSVKTIGALLCGLVFTLAAFSAVAANRTLLILESAPKATVKLEIMDKPGVQRADPIAASALWELKPGDPIHADKQPADRVVELYSGTRLAPNLLCQVTLRYYAGENGWTPQFRLDQEPAVIWVNGHWQPLKGTANIVQHGNVLPNAEGFFRTIEFGLSAGSLTIVAWQVR